MVGWRNQRSRAGGGDGIVIHLVQIIMDLIGILDKRACVSEYRTVGVYGCHGRGICCDPLLAALSYQPTIKSLVVRLVQYDVEKAARQVYKIAQCLVILRLPGRRESAIDCFPD